MTLKLKITIKVKATIKKYLTLVIIQLSQNIMILAFIVKYEFKAMDVID